MDMDDIPLPEELQWLESNTLLPEDEEEDYYWQPPDPEEEEAAAAEEQQKPENKCLESSGTSEDLINGKKRPLSKVSSSFEEEEEAPPSSSDAKRNRLLVHTETEIDEDWLRYDSTSRENVVESLPPSVVVMEEEEMIISRFASEVEGDCISVTGPCGDRVYAKISQLETDDVTNKKFNIRGSAKGLISEPVSTLLEGLEQDVLTKALQLRPESDDLVDPQSSVVTEDLWVDKYGPCSFTELLSDEQTNREVLLWLKQWDSCVFGSEIRSTTDDVLSALRRHSSLAQHQKISFANSFRNNRGSYSTSKASKHPDNSNRDVNNLNGMHDSWNKQPMGTGPPDQKVSKGMHDSWNKKAMGTGPPDQKVLLLCGPPGLGKTTLAHITAKHCGYRVVEINASDDRSSSMIEAKILDVVQMNSVMADAKPKCLVIDEIDGALGEGKGAVEVILKMVATERKSEDGKEYVAEKDQPGTFSSKKGRKYPRLLRPVICICNDLYAPSLRQLRQVAKVHIFVKPTTSRVVSRLKYICNKEGLRTSSIALTALAEYTECDIRSCLNTLQFLNKKKENLNVLEISSQVVGRKDVSRSLFDVWKEVFQRRKTKGERKSISGFSSMYSDFDFLHSLICSRGEYELTMDGIHENILQLHYHDPMMQKTVKCLNILGDSDYLHQCIMRTQQMALYAYQPFTAIAICRLVAQIRKPNIEWPRSSHRCRTKLIEKKDHLRCWHKKISPSISRHLSAESFVENDLSPLLYILSPPTLRPVAFHLLSEREKNDLDHLVNTMVSCSITYKSMKTERLTNIPRYEAVSDASTLTFDPPIGDFINFKGYISYHSGLSLAIKQVLVQEVEKQRIMCENICRSTNRNVGQDTKKLVSLKEKVDKTLSIRASATTAYAENLENNDSSLRQCKANTSATSTTLGSNTSITASMKPKASGVRKKQSGSSNFFDRFRNLSGKGSQNPDSALQKPATSNRDSRPLIFKYNEGFTNAVKKPVRISELLS